MYSLLCVRRWESFQRAPRYHLQGNERFVFHKTLLTWKFETCARALGNSSVYNSMFILSIDQLLFKEAVRYADVVYCQITNVRRNFSSSLLMQIFMTVCYSLIDFYQTYLQVTIFRHLCASCILKDYLILHMYCFLLVIIPNWVPQWYTSNLLPS